jgi:hypothetical protein
MAGRLEVNSPPGEEPSFLPSSFNTHKLNCNHQLVLTTTDSHLSPLRSNTVPKTAHPLITPPSALQNRQNADCSNSIVAAVNAATVLVSRSLQQSLATVSQALQQASIDASAALVSASAASASASNLVAAASLQMASLKSSASAAVANASMGLIAVQERASSVEVSGDVNAGSK